MTKEELDRLIEQGADAEFDEEEDYSINVTKWPPPPPLTENKVVHQLDNVTQESEEKATQIFDMLELITNEQMSAEEQLNSVAGALRSQMELMDKLTNKFPHIETFKTQGEKLSGAMKANEAALDNLANIAMNCMSIMGMMQYQDIHRQKIERVINIMRALSNYMNKLFEGQIDDERRVSSAKHIHGDSNSELADEDDIEALIAAFGKK